MNPETTHNETIEFNLFNNILYSFKNNSADSFLPILAYELIQVAEVRLVQSAIVVLKHWK